MYFYANLYILFFWVVYRFIIHGAKDFQVSRLYIVLSFVFATILPFLQKGLSGLFLNRAGISGINLYNFIYSINSPEKSSQFVTGNSTPDAEQLVSLFILAGGLVTIVIFLINHVKIRGIKRNSRLIRSGYHEIYISHRPILPFIYNKAIIIPDSVSGPDLEIIIRHESFHHELAHHLDIILVQVFQSVFWLNPFIYLLKRELFRLHEYQVDQLVISSGVDPLDYKYVLIRNSAGSQKFFVANGLKNNNLKKRILMMNTEISKSGSWKYFLLVPAISAIFILMSFFSIDPAASTVNLQFDGQAVKESDSVKISIVELPTDYRATDRNEVLIVLINKVSQIAIDGKLASAATVESAIEEGFKAKIEKKFGEVKSSMISKEITAIKIIIQKDRETNEGSYTELLNRISAAIFSLQDDYGQKLFSKPFKTLVSSEKEVLLQLIPPVIYVSPPKMVKNVSREKK
jgi:hypothetical protein